MIEELGGKVAVVTGAASGIGRATATAFAGEGMRVVLADVEEKALESAARSLRDAGHDVLSVVTDVSKGASMDALADRAFDHFGAVHVVHLNAGVGAGGPMWTLTENDWQWVLGVNLWGVIHGVRAFVPRLLEQGGPAHVVNTASMAGLTSPTMMGAYNVSKHGVVALSETLARDLAVAGAPVGVSVLCPGWVNTGIADSSRNRPDELRNDAAGAGVDLAAASPLKQLLESGLSPDTVASMVVDAVKTGTFYILTNDSWRDAVQQRLDDILAGRGPTPMALPT
ncbi:MAG TPA: SDR family NAD(P)-dependent oxidoreductase [Acidimicrobiales bacterium]|nr:SDR family NAD(P)-dependent oxidoreductase [Acidimicrobiales bacterium]